MSKRKFIIISIGIIICSFILVVIVRKTLGSTISILSPCLLIILMLYERFIEKLSLIEQIKFIKTKNNNTTLSMIFFSILIAILLTLTNFCRYGHASNSISLYQIFIIISIYVVTAVQEEVFFRGFLFEKLNYYNNKTKIMYSSFIFMLAHYIGMLFTCEGYNGIQKYDEFHIISYLIMTFILGVFLGKYYAIYNNIISLILLHFTWDVISEINGVLYQDKFYRIHDVEKLRQIWMSPIVIAICLLIVLIVINELKKQKLIVKSKLDKKQ